MKINIYYLRLYFVMICFLNDFLNSPCIQGWQHQAVFDLSTPIFPVQGGRRLLNCVPSDYSRHTRSKFFLVFLVHEGQDNQVWDLVIPGLSLLNCWLLVNFMYIYLFLYLSNFYLDTHNFYFDPHKFYFDPRNPRNECNLKDSPGFH